jgi:hypothetical protein
MQNLLLAATIPLDGYAWPILFNDGALIGLIVLPANAVADVEKSRLFAGHLSNTTLFRPRPHLRVSRRNCSLRQVRIHGACADSKPCRQNVKSKSFRLIFCLKHSGSSLLLSAYWTERDIPLLRERQRDLRVIVILAAVRVSATEINPLPATDRSI